MAMVNHSPYEPRISTAELQGRFDTQWADEDQKQLVDRIRSRIKNIVQDINENVLDSREKSQALTELETAAMWISKAIYASDRSPKVSGQTEEVKEKPISIFWDGKKDRNVELWLDDRFVDWAIRNVSGPYPDEVVLTILSNDGIASEVPPNSVLTRVSNGDVYILSQAQAEEVVSG